MWSGVAIVNDRTEGSERDVCFQSGSARSALTSGTGAVIPGPWSVTFDGTTATFSNCMYMRGPVTHTFDDMTHSISGTGTVYLYLKVSTADDTVEIKESSSISDAYDSYEPSDPAYYKVLLYKVSDDSGDFEVVVDYRAVPAALLYI